MTQSLRTPTNGDGRNFIQSANQPLFTVLFLVISHNSLIPPQYLLSLAKDGIKVVSLSVLASYSLF